MIHRFFNVSKQTKSKSTETFHSTEKLRKLKNIGRFIFLKKPSHIVLETKIQ